MSRKVKLKEIAFGQSMMFNVGSGGGTSIAFGKNNFENFSGTLDLDTGEIVIVHPKGVRSMHLAQCRYADYADEVARPMQDELADELALRRLEAEEKTRAAKAKAEVEARRAAQEAAGAAAADPDNPDHVPAPDFDSDEDLHRVEEVKSGSGKQPKKAIGVR